MKLFTEYKCGGRENNLRGNLGFPYKSGQRSEVRTWNMHDIDQIIYSNDFRKLSDKIQLLPYEHPRNRTRLIHTLEVVRIAKEIAKNLDINVELTEAIALGHDLGNSALGRAGNAVISDKCEVHHQEISALVAEVLSAKYADRNNIGSRLNNVEKMCYIEDTNSRITYLAADICDTHFEFPIQPEVLDGIRYHSEDRFPSTLEGQAVRHADNFAYLVQDIDDALKAGIIDADLYEQFGRNDEINGRTWESLNRTPEVPGTPDLRFIYSQNTGERVGALVTRFVEYHKHKNDQEGYSQTIPSDFVEQGKVPQLELDEGLDFVVRSVWDFIGEHIHSNPIISSTQNLYRNYAERVVHMIEENWEIYTDFNRIIDKCVSDRHHEKNIYYIISVLHPKLKLLPKKTLIAFIVNTLSFTDIKEIVHKYNKMAQVKKIHL